MSAHRLKDGEGRYHDVSLRRDGDAFVLVREGREERFAIVLESEGELVLDGPDGRRRLRFARRDGTVHVVVEGKSHRFAKELAAGPEDAGHDADEAVLESPMTGRVVKLMKAAGDAVAEGEVVLVVEAMKMEHQLRSPLDGLVESLGCAEGEQVDMGRELARLRRRADESDASG